MEEFDLMEENLARLISQHHSLPQLCHEQPSDPFQKIHFGKKMRKSKVKPSHCSSNICQNNSNWQIQDSKRESISKIHHEIEQHEDNESTVEQQISSIFNKLHQQLNKLEKDCKIKVQREAKLPQKQKQKSKKIEDMMIFLQSSANFIVNNCLKIDNLEHFSQKEYDRGVNKQNIRNNNSGRYKAKSQGRNKQKAQKSVYEAVLEQREMRRGRRRMI